MSPDRNEGLDFGEYACSWHHVATNGKCHSRVFELLKVLDSDLPKTLLVFVHFRQRVRPLEILGGALAAVVTTMTPRFAAR